MEVCGFEGDFVVKFGHDKSLNTREKSLEVVAVVSSNFELSKTDQ
jgi:hypothetical protein